MQSFNRAAATTLTLVVTPWKSRLQLLLHTCILLFENKLKEEMKLSLAAYQMLKTENSLLSKQEQDPMRV